MLKIATVGDIGIDYYENLELSKPGGIAFNFAYNLKESGIKNVSLISVLGNDRFSKKLNTLLKKVGVDISHLQKLSGTVPKQKIFLKRGERKFTGYDPGVLRKWRLKKKDLVFIKSQSAVFVPINDGMEHIFNAVKKINGPIKAVDFSQDYEFADFDKKDNVITKNAKYFDVIFVGGQIKHKEMIKKLAKKFPEKVFILTLGSKGSYTLYNHQEHFEPAKKVKVVDTTGAGDAFQAGFLASWLKTKNIKKSLQKGILRALFIIKYVGSTPLVIK